MDAPRVECADETWQLFPALTRLVGWLVAGSLHYYVNDNCEPSTMLATFNNGDPGTVVAVDVCSPATVKLGCSAWPAQLGPRSVFAATVFWQLAWTRLAARQRRGSVSQDLASSCFTWHARFCFLASFTHHKRFWPLAVVVRSGGRHSNAGRCLGGAVAGHAVGWAAGGRIRSQGGPDHQPAE